MAMSLDSASRELCAKLGILVVEDSPPMLRLLSTVLAAMGFQRVMEAAEGDSALKLVREEKPDIIVTDGAMAPMDGYELTRRIRAGGAGEDLRDMPILMLSGHATQQHLDQARANGVTDFIAKPITAELLYRCVLAALTNPQHVVEMRNYRGPSPRRRLEARHSQNMPEL